MEEAEGVKDAKETNDSWAVQSHRAWGSMHRICTGLGQMWPYDERESRPKTASLAKELSPNDNP